MEGEGGGGGVLGASEAETAGEAGELAGGGVGREVAGCDVKKYIAADGFSGGCRGAHDLEEGMIAPWPKSWTSMTSIVLGLLRGLWFLLHRKAEPAGSPPTELPPPRAFLVSGQLPATSPGYGQR